MIQGAPGTAHSEHRLRRGPRAKEGGGAYKKFFKDAGQLTLSTASAEGRAHGSSAVQLRSSAASCGAMPGGGRGASRCTSSCTQGRRQLFFFCF